MIKILALILMVIDHIGFILKSGIIKTRAAFFLSQFFIIMGRFSMPLFAYCIARGFSHYLQSGNIKKYFRNISIMAIVSQLPYMLLRYKSYSFMKYPEKISFFYEFNFNIGFVWLVSLTLLYLLSKIDFFNKKDLLSFLSKKNLIYISLSSLVCVASIFAKLDYGLYAVLFPIMFYYFCFKFNNPFLLFISNILLYFIHILEHINNINIGQSNQIFVIFVIFLIYYLKKYDNLIRLPKFIFYWFYPLHLAVLAIPYMTIFIKH